MYEKRKRNNTESSSSSSSSELDIGENEEFLSELYGTFFKESMKLFKKYCEEGNINGLLSILDSQAFKNIVLKDISEMKARGLFTSNLIKYLVSGCEKNGNDFIRNLISNGGENLNFIMPEVFACCCSIGEKDLVEKLINNNNIWTDEEYGRDYAISFGMVEACQKWQNDVVESIINNENGKKTVLNYEKNFTGECIMNLYNKLSKVEDTNEIKDRKRSIIRKLFSEDSLITRIENNKKLDTEFINFAFNAAVVNLNANNEDDSKIIDVFLDNKRKFLKEFKKECMSGCLSNAYKYNNYTFKKIINSKELSDKIENDLLVRFLLKAYIEDKKDIYETINNEIKNRQTEVMNEETVSKSFIIICKEGGITEEGYNKIINNKVIADKITGKYLYENFIKICKKGALEEEELERIINNNTIFKKISEYSKNFILKAFQTANTAANSQKALSCFVNSTNERVKEQIKLEDKKKCFETNIDFCSSRIEQIKILANSIAKEDPEYIKSKFNEAYNNNNLYLVAALIEPMFETVKEAEPKFIENFYATLYYMGKYEDLGLLVKNGQLAPSFLKASFEIAYLNYSKKSGEDELIRAFIDNGKIDIETRKETFLKALEEEDKIDLSEILYSSIIKDEKDFLFRELIAASNPEKTVLIFKFMIENEPEKAKKILNFKTVRKQKEIVQLAIDNDLITEELISKIPDKEKSSLLYEIIKVEKKQFDDKKMKFSELLIKYGANINIEEQGNKKTKQEKTEEKNINNNLDEIMENLKNENKTLYEDRKKQIKKAKGKFGQIKTFLDIINANNNISPENEQTLEKS